MRTLLLKEKEQSQLQERRRPDRESVLGGCSHTGGRQVFTGKAMPVQFMVLHLYNHQFRSVQSFSQLQLFATPWTAAHWASLSVQHQLLEPAQTHVHRVDDAIQPSHLAISLYSHIGY